MKGFIVERNGAALRSLRLSVMPPHAFCLGRGAVGARNRGSLFTWVGSGMVVLSFALVLAVAGPIAAVAADLPRAKDVTFDPQNPETGGKLKVLMKLENAVRAEVKWHVNDTEVQTDSYDGIADGVDFRGELKTGDGVEARITPFDTNARSGAQVSRRVKVVKAPPTLKKVSEKLDPKTKIYKAKVEATDPDKDKITFTIHGPSGMTIDGEGNITWDTSKIKEWRGEVRVTGQDSHGSKADLGWSIGIRQEATK